jgi:hypothetical protein
VKTKRSILLRGCEYIFKNFSCRILALLVDFEPLSWESVHFLALNLRIEIVYVFDCAI